MADLPVEHKLVSIAPIMEFDIETFVQWIRDIRPSMVYVGCDNNHKLTEPNLTKTELLINQLSHFTSKNQILVRIDWPDLDLFSKEYLG